MEERWLVTGALGCIGAWLVHELLDEGVRPAIVDQGGSRHRLGYLLDAATAEGLDVRAVDIADGPALQEVYAAVAPTHVVHLAALQVPFCRADPPAGAAVNVLGTINLMEAAARAGLATPLVYASSVAAYGLEDEPDIGGRVAEVPHGRPATLYGVYKRATEDAAAIYAAERGLSSVGLRPYVVYGVGRDQGMTSVPTVAMLAAAAGLPFHISWGGRAQYQHGRDAARAFIAAARSSVTGAPVYNLAGASADMAEVVAAIEAAAPQVAGRVSFDPVQLPFPPVIEAERFAAEVGPLAELSLADGVADSVARFRALLDAGAIEPPAPAAQPAAARP